MSLSAVAARKAAQIAKLKEQSESRTEGSLSSTIISEVTPEQSKPVPANSVSIEAKAICKRKTRGEDITSGPKNKRPKKLTNADIGVTRYFEAQYPIGGFEDESVEDKIQSRPAMLTPGFVSSSISKHNISGGDQYEDSEKSPLKRAYSPSRAFNDSSEETDSHLSVDSNTVNQQNYSPQDLFWPRKDINAFSLTQEEINQSSFNSETDNAAGTMLLLSVNQSISFIGSARLTVVCGSVSVFGTPIYPSTKAHRVYSPKCSILANITSLQSSPNIKNGFCHIVDRIPVRLRKHVERADTVLIIQSLQTGVTGLGKIFRPLKEVFEIPLHEKESEAVQTIAVKGFHLIDLQLHPRTHLQSFIMPESWKVALQTVMDRFQDNSTNVDNFIAIIKGPKKCGKSTFARTLLNWLCLRFRHIAFLECDLGQAEFTPGGMVSLNIISSPILGPPFTHISQSYRAHFVGHTTPRSNPSHYLACIEDLVQTYRINIKYMHQEMAQNEASSTTGDKRSDSFVPLVVNTQGWFKGLGGNLLSRIEAIVDPTDIFNLDPQASATSTHLQSSSSGHLHIIQPIISSALFPYYTAVDYRFMSLLSYFHLETLICDGEEIAWSTGIPLCAVPPWEIRCCEVIDQIVLLGTGYEDVVLLELERVMNGSIVALVSEDDCTTTNKIQSNYQWPYTQGASPPSPTTSHCVGLAFIRSLDRENCTLHLLTPANSAQLARCNVIVKGEIEMPIWGFLDFRENSGVAGVRWERVPYLEMSKDAVIMGGARRKIRKNLMRRSQM